VVSATAATIPEVAGASFCTVCIGIRGRGRPENTDAEAAFRCARDTSPVQRCGTSDGFGDKWPQDFDFTSRVLSNRSN